MMKDTMEERVLELQREKLELASGLLTTKTNKGGGLNINEMRKLFAL